MAGERGASGRLRRAGVTGLLAGILLPASALSGGSEVVDPTRPPGGASQAVSLPADGRSGEGLELQSLLLGEGRRLAIINGRPVRVGEQVRGFTVQNILKREVVLVHGGETRVLQMAPTEGLEKVPSN